MKWEYHELRRQQMDELQKKRADILKNQVEKTRHAEQQLAQKKRKVQEQKDARKQQDA